MASFSFYIKNKHTRLHFIKTEDPIPQYAPHKTLKSTPQKRPMGWGIQGERISRGSVSHPLAHSLLPFLWEQERKASGRNRNFVVQQGFFETNKPIPYKTPLTTNSVCYSRRNWLRLLSSTPSFRSLPISADMALRSTCK